MDKIITLENLETFAEINDTLKADKAVEAITGNLAKFDENGNPVDSGFSSLQISILNNKVNTLEEAVGNGGSVDERIAEECAKHYTKEETYNKTELNSLITTPNQKYVSVTAIDQTTTSADVLPAIGEANTIYRVGSWDGTQYDTACYSEYAWKGDAYIHLSTKSQIGEVFDISAYHSNTPYVDLSAALDSNNGGGVPQSLQKGGMSIKFVQSSDNKYVQYRLMSDEWSTDTDDWAIADEGVYVENPEFVEVHTDSEDKISWGVKKDGDFYFGSGVPSQIQEAIDETGKIIVDYFEEIEDSEWNDITIDQDSKIVEGTKKDGSKYVAAIESPAIDELKQEIANIKSVISKQLSFPTIPYTGYGRMVISDIIDTYCHAPYIVSRDNDVYVLYHASSVKNYEDPSANIDRIVLKHFKETHPYNIDRLVVVDATHPFYYDGLPAKIIYNGNINLLKDNSTLFIKFSCQIEDDNPQLFGIKYNKDFLFNRNDYFPLKIKYTYNNEEIVEDYTKKNYIAMINSLYDAGIESNTGVSIECQDTILYNNLYYKIETAGEGIRKRPMVLMTSNDCVTWTPILNITDDIPCNEVDFKIVSDKLYILARTSNSDGYNGGVYYLTCNLNGTDLTTPLFVSDVESKPNTFLFEGKVYGVYNIPSTGIPNSIRTKIQVSELKPDGTISLIQTITNYESIVYPYVCNHKGRGLLFSNVEQNGNSAQQNCIVYSRLKLELENN